MQEYLRETVQMCASSVPAGAVNDVKATVIVLAYSCLVSSMCCVWLSIVKYLFTSNCNCVLLGACVRLSVLCVDRCVDRS